MGSTVDHHAEYRKKVCVVCYKKAERSISECKVKSIQDQLIHGYTIDNFDFPCGLCNNCHHLVQKNII